MKGFILVIFALACLGALVDAKGSKHKGGHSFSNSASHEKGPGGKHGNDILKSVNNTVQMILNAKLEGGTVLWDLLPPLLRFTILNQVQFQSPDWNVTELVISKKSNLLWSELPQNIKSALLEEKAKNAFPTLTFEQLNLVSDPTDPLAKVTIKQVLPKKVVDLLPNITELLKDISFDTPVNTTALRDALLHKAPMNFFGGFHKSSMKVCMWNLLMGGDNSMENFNDLMIWMITNANLKQMWQAKLLNRLNSHRMKLGNINELCYMLNMSKLLMRSFR